MCARPQPAPDRSRVFKGEIETTATILYEQNMEGPSPVGRVYHVEMNGGHFLMASNEELFPGRVIEFRGEFRKVGNFYGYVPNDIDVDCLLDKAA